MGRFTDLARELGALRVGREVVTATLPAGADVWAVEVTADGLGVVSVRRNGRRTTIEDACGAFGQTVAGLARLARDAYEAQERESGR